MKKVFTIRPALFDLMPRQPAKPAIGPDNRQTNKINSDSKDPFFSNGYPQTYPGSCQFNADHTMLSIRYSARSVLRASVLNLPVSILKPLDPITFEGRHYTFTYIEVNN